MPQKGLTTSTNNASSNAALVITEAPTPNTGCEGCNRQYHSRFNCLFSKNKHPDYNRDGSWLLSEIGQFYTKNGRYGLKAEEKREGNEFVARDTSNGIKMNKRKHVRTKSKCEICNVVTSLNNSNNRLINITLIQDKQKLVIKETLLDTGADKSYIDEETELWLRKHGAIEEVIPKLVCSCFGDCKYIDKCFTVNVQFENVNNKNKFFTIPIKFWVIPNLPYPAIIGNGDLEEDKNLYQLFHQQPENLRTENVPVNPEPQGPLSIPSLSVHEKRLVNGVLQSPVTDPASDKPCACLTASTGVIMADNGGTFQPAVQMGTKTHVTQLLDFEQDAFGRPDIWDSIDETVDAERHYGVTDTRSLIPTSIEGSDSLKNRILILLEEYKDIFRRDVSDTPAKFGEAYTIQVDTDLWKKVRGNYGVPPRKQSIDKEAEIKRQIDILVKRNVIRIASANVDRYSQVHLVKKSNGGWRMTNDFVGLNSVCKGESWNLPNIKEMLYRIGDRKPKYFAVMDLTSGYHQAPISKSSIRFTAFITFMGLYEWIRLPMGLKGAASFFQKMLATVVLIGLMHRICELYIDDIIMHAQTEDEFMDNLLEIFKRFRKHNVTLNPDKCKFGLSEIEYVGHKIDSTGITFMSEKLEAVLNKELPVFPKDMKSLLGLLS